MHRSVYRNHILHKKLQLHGDILIQTHCINRSQIIKYHLQLVLSKPIWNWSEFFLINFELFLPLFATFFFITYEEISWMYKFILPFYFFLLRVLVFYFYLFVLQFIDNFFVYSVVNYIKFYFCCCLWYFHLFFFNF